MSTCASHEHSPTPLPHNLTAAAVCALPSPRPARRYATQFSNLSLNDAFMFCLALQGSALAVSSYEIMLSPVIITPVAKKAD